MVQNISPIKISKRNVEYFFFGGNFLYNFWSLLVLLLREYGANCANKIIKSPLKTKTIKIEKSLITIEKT